MAVPAIALYASPPSTVSSPYQTTGPHDVDFNSRSASSSSTSSSPASQKPFLGGLSCLFSSKHAASATTTTASSPGGGEELAGCRRHERGGEVELGSSFSYLHYSPFSSSLKREQSPVSVFHGPVSCGSSSGTGFCKSPPLRILGERNGDGSKRLFDGFVRKALSSCIDYGAQSFEVHGRSSVLDEELPFNMEDDDFDETEPSANELLISAQKRHKIFYDDFVVKAFHEAEKAHRGQMRASGDPYLQHCVETAVLLALVGANSTMVAAGLLHDTLDDSFLTYDYIFKTFGAGVADLVEGVSKLSELSKLARDNDTASKSAEADRLHTMFLAMADARAVLIKLADRLHNMMTLDSLPLPKQQRFAKETLEIFAPLANRLGIFSWKEKLENLCFKHINPEQHKDLSSKLVQSFDGTMITSNIQKLEHALKGAGISYHVLSGRPKSVYSIYCKMLKKNLNMSEIHDIHGLRLILENEEDCYEALEIVRCIWSEVPGKFKDYIRRPKFNGYQSLHTVVIGEGGVPIEVQIRTKEMHQQAEIGFAAHWRYKEGGCRYSSFVLQMVEWARWIITWQCEATGNDKSCIGSCRSDMPLCSFPFHSEDCPHSYKPHCDQDGPVFIVVMENDKMSVQEFPSNSTMADLLESVGRGSSRWGSYGFPMKEDLKPRLNSEPVTDPTCLLKMGDIVELTPAISDKSLTEYREEIQRMYDQDLSISSSWPAPRMVGGRS